MIRPDQNTKRYVNLRFSNALGILFILVFSISGFSQTYMRVDSSYIENESGEMVLQFDTIYKVRTQMGMSIGVGDTLYVENQRSGGMRTIVFKDLDQVKDFVFHNIVPPFHNEHAVKIGDTVFVENIETGSMEMMVIQNEKDLAKFMKQN